MSSLDTLNGWLSPEGILHACEKGGHWELCARLVKQHVGETKQDPQRVIERLGWAKLHTDTDSHQSHWTAHRLYHGDPTFNIKDLSDRQRRTIAAWEREHKRSTPLTRILAGSGPCFPEL